jgi:hypothetical protein
MHHPGTQNTADLDARAYRIRTLKIFGGIQIVMGIADHTIILLKINLFSL